MKICIQKLLLITLIISLASCGTSNKIGYFRDLDHSKTNNSVISNYSVAKIQPGDMLSITVTGNKESVAPFNPVVDDNTATPISGYRVNQAGEITMPIIGVVKAAGLTTDELKAKLLPLILPDIKTGDVVVRLTNFKISVLGDVAKPDQYTIANEHINILEALALAGDLNVTAKRDDILLIREENGTRHAYPINLGTKKLYDLPYYYLQNNDILVVEPGREKADQADTRSYRTASLALSGLSVIAVLISLFRR